MSAPIAGFICAVVLAILVIIWIAFCMFCRERHKSDHIHYDISDLRHRNYQLEQEDESDYKESPKKKEAMVGVFILPSRHKQKDEDYLKRPDYPESPPPALHASADKLAELINDNVADADIHYKDGILEIDSNAQYHSEV